jgi:hypothetical protein
MRQTPDPARLRVLDHRVEVTKVEAKLVGESQRRELPARNQAVDGEAASKTEIGRRLLGRQEPLFEGLWLLMVE